MPHQATVRAYKDAQFDYQNTSHDLAEEEFIKWNQLSGRTPTVIVNHITRTKIANEEWITWGETRIGYDHVGNEKTFTEDRMGQYIIPIFNKSWDTRTNRVVAVAVTKKETRYDTPYSVEKLRELYKQADRLAIKFYVKTGTTRYMIKRYEDFEQGKYEDLLELGNSKFASLQELLNSRQTMIPVSMVDKIDRDMLKERKFNKKDE